MQKRTLLLWRRWELLITKGRLQWVQIDPFFCLGWMGGSVVHSLSRRYWDKILLLLSCWLVRWCLVSFSKSEQKYLVVGRIAEYLGNDRWKLQLKGSLGKVRRTNLNEFNVFSLALKLETTEPGYLMSVCHLFYR